MNSSGTPVLGGLEQAEITFLVNQSADGVVVLGEDGIVLFANPAAEQMFGRAQSDLLGSPLGIPLVAGETTEITIIRPRGDQIDTEIRTVETNWNNRAVRLASLRDISTRKATEENLRHAAKMEAVGQLTAGIAHDFNNLLTVVLGNLETAQRRFNITNPDLLLALENATRGAKRAASLTERLLAFARRKPLEPQVVDANDLVSRISDLLHRTLGDGIAVRTHLPADVWSLEADPTELEAAILNLAVNARDAMPEGGELLIETANIELGEAYSNRHDLSPGYYVMISVTDSGMGMPADILKHVFEPFFTTKADGHGTGLGLSQVYGFAKQSGGHIRLYSEPGVGTTARLYLPRAPETDSNIRPRTPASDGILEQLPRALHGETILVVEDNDDVRDFAASTLRELDYAVREAAHAHSALRLLASDVPIDLLITDLGLPGGMDGKELAQRAKSIRPSIKVLITTAYAGRSLVHQGRLDPGIELLSKPFTQAHLASRVRVLLDEAAPQRTGSILFVEDEFLIRDFFATTLTDAGYDVEQAADYREAVGKLSGLGAKLACAVIDVGLPDKNGDDLAEEIRRTIPRVPIILATGFAERALHDRFASATDVAIITKPFDPETLMRTLKRLGVIQRNPR